MKKYLFLGLIYSLNIILFLFAKSAGAVVNDRSPAIENLKASKLVVLRQAVILKESESRINGRL